MESVCGLIRRNNDMEIRNSSKAVASLVCGILSLFIPFLGFMLGAMSIVFGILSRNEIHQSEGKLIGKGMAIAGFICGIVGIAWNLILLTILRIIGSGFDSLFLDTLMTALKIQVL